MEYTTRIVRSVEGLSQEDALITLQEHPQLVPGTKIASLQDQDGHWVAKLLVPKTANEELEEISEKKVDKDEPDFHDEKKHEEHEESESPFEEAKEHKSDDKGGDSGDKKIQALEKKLDKLLEALGIADEAEGPVGPSADGAVPPPPAGAPAPAGPKPPKGVAGGPELPNGSGAKLKPGEVPNKPGVTPIGSPAFASVQTAQANPPVIQTSPTATPPAPTDAGVCPRCHGAGCDTCRAKKGPSAMPAPVASFVATRLDSNKDISIRQAKISLENEFASRGFRVARIKREGEYLRALMTRNDS